MTWKHVKNVLKSEQKAVEETVLSAKKLQLLEAELKSLVETTNEVNQSKSKIRQDSFDFQIWLSTNFSSNEKFLSFLDKLELTEDDKELITFRNEYKIALPSNVTAKHYLSWNNYTTYKKPVLIMTAFKQYYSELPQRYTVTFVEKGVTGKAKKSKLRKKKDTGTSKEYLHKTKVKVGEVLRFLHLNGVALRKNMITKFEVLPNGRILPSKVRASDKEVVKQYSFLHTYLFKQMNQHGLSAYKGKREVQSMKASRGRRIDSIEANGKAFTTYKKYLLENLGFDMFYDLTADDKEINKRITIANKLFRAKAFDGDITKQKAELFKNKYSAAVIKWKKESL